MASSHVEPLPVEDMERRGAASSSARYVSRATPDGASDLAEEDDSGLRSAKTSEWRTGGEAEEAMTRSEAAEVLGSSMV